MLFLTCLRTIHHVPHIFGGPAPLRCGFFPILRRTYPQTKPAAHCLPIQSETTGKLGDGGPVRAKNIREQACFLIQGEGIDSTAEPSA